MESLYVISTGEYLGWYNGNDLQDDQAITTVVPPDYDFMTQKIRWTGSEWEILDL